MAHTQVFGVRNWLVTSLVGLTCLGLVSATGVQAAELPDVTLILPPVAGERVWDFADQGEFTGTLVDVVGGKAHIRMSDGVVREFEPGWSKGGSAAALRRAMCRIPDNSARPALGDGNAPVLQLTAEQLSEGPLTQWPNRGRLGGSFVAMAMNPQVTTVVGRKAVLFAHPRWTVPLENQALVSDFIMPLSELYGRSMTVVVDVCNLERAESRETLLGFAPLTGKDGVQFSYGCFKALDWYGDKVEFVPASYPRFGQWHRLVYVIERSAVERKDKDHGQVTLYVDGRFVTQRPLRKTDKRPLADNHAFVGAYWEDAWGGSWMARPSEPFTGAISSLALYDRVLSTHEFSLTPVAALAAADPLPHHGQVLDVLTPVLAWRPASATAVAGRVYLSSDRTAVEQGAPAALIATVKDPLCTPKPLSNGTHYYWKVVPDGAMSAQMPVWEFTATDGGARNPDPAHAAGEVRSHLVSLRWSPGSATTEQRLIFGTDAAAVMAGSATSVTLAPGHDEAFITTRHLLGSKRQAASGGAVGGDASAAPESSEKHDDGKPAYLPLARLTPGTTYHWRVEQVLGQGKSALRIPGTVWSFTTAPVDLDDDGPAPEPFPVAVRQDGYYGRYLQTPGSHIICPPDALDEYMRIARYSIMKLTGKRPDVVQALASANAACHLSTPESPGWSAGNGWSQFTCAAYGGAYSIARRSAIVMHEMGHQFHMYGCEWLDPTFKERHKQNFIANYRERKWMGGYGAVNKHENFAVWASGWINDGTWDVGATTPREVLRQSDPRMFHLLAEYFPGDTLIELDPLRAIDATADGVVRSWENSGGADYYQQGWHRFARTVGTFIPQGSPRLTTVGGVSAVAFDGKSTLRWDQTTWEALDGNRSWSVELWMQRSRPASGDEVFVEWGGEGAARLGWSADGQAWRCGTQSGRWKAPATIGRWQHVVFVYSGGGITNGPGTLTTYLDGVVDHQASVTLALPSNAALSIGRGFTGALAHVRIYNYHLHPLQIAQIRQQSEWYRRDALAVADTLLIDCSADALAPYQQVDVWPTYPASLKQPWLRSWANRGVLGGRLFNESGVTRSRGPLPLIHAGAAALSFANEVRLTSHVLPPVPSAASMEAWVSVVARPDAAAVVAQWGDLQIPAALVPVGGWHHVAVTSDAGRRTAYLDGQAVTLPTITARQITGAPRLSVGACWDGRVWSGHLNGAIAQVRVHRGVLTQAQIAANARRTGPTGASAPLPADGALVESVRGLALAWSVGAFAGAADVYVGQDATALATADRASKSLYLGPHRSGEARPTLVPGQHYVWRVDPLDAEGKPLARGPLWTFRVANGLVVDLRSEDLGGGSFTSWRNRGSAGGAFVPGSTSVLRQPYAERRDGRAAVNFDGERSLFSSALVPSSLRQGFTVAAWVLTEELPGSSAKDRSNTWLSFGQRDQGGTEFLWNWQPDGGLFLHGTKKQRIEFGYRSGISDVKVARNTLPAVMALRWHHVAVTYGAGTVRFFVDGSLNREEPVTLDLVADVPFCLGAGVGERRVETWFNGCLGGVAIAARALDAAAIMALVRSGAAVPTSGEWLVLLDPTALPEGRVASWPNRGSLGGTFAPEREIPRAPAIENVGGRPGATFDGRTTFLRSDVPTPLAVTGDRPFTVEVELFNPKLEKIETVFALAPALAMHDNARHRTPRMVNCNIGSVKPPEVGKQENDYPSAFAAGKPTLAWNEPPPAGAWCRVTWVYTGGADGEIRCYVDGHLAASRGAVSLNTATDQSMYLGCDWNTALGFLSPFSGTIGALRVWDHAHSLEQIAARITGR